MIIKISEKQLKEWITDCLDVDWTGVATLKDGKKGKFKARLPKNLREKIAIATVAYLKAFKN